MLLMKHLHISGNEGTRQVFPLHAEPFTFFTGKLCLRFCCETRPHAKFFQRKTRYTNQLGSFTVLSIKSCVFHKAKMTDLCKQVELLSQTVSVALNEHSFCIVFSNKILQDLHVLVSSEDASVSFFNSL